MGAKRYMLNVKLSINPAMREQFLASVRNNAAGTAKEPGCRSYSWGESTRESNVFHFQEVFDSAAAFDAHAAAPHFKEWERTFASLPGAFIAPPVLDFFQEL